MTGPVQSAATESELLNALVMRVARAYDATRSSRELVSLSGELLRLLKARENLRNAEAREAIEAAETAEAIRAREERNAATEAEAFAAWIASQEKR